MRELPYRTRDVALKMWLVNGVIDVKLAGRVLVEFGLCIRLVNRAFCGPVPRRDSTTKRAMALHLLAAYGVPIRPKSMQPHRQCSAINNTN